MAGNKKPRKKYNPDSPKRKKYLKLRLPLNRTELIQLKTPAHQSLISIKQGTGTKTDLWNVSFRIRCGYEIAKLVYEPQTVEEFKAVFDMANKYVIKAYTEGTDGWFLTDDEIEDLSNAINTVDILNDDVNRTVQLMAYKKAQEDHHRMLEDLDPEEAEQQAQIIAQMEKEEA